MIDFESTFFFPISWHPAEIWEKKMQKLMLHWNFVKVICASCKTKFKTIMIYEISWHPAEKTEISSFLHWKVRSKIFLPNSMQWQSSSVVNTLVFRSEGPRFEPPLGQTFFPFFYDFFVNLYYFSIKFQGKLCVKSHFF